MRFLSNEKGVIHIAGLAVAALVVFMLAPGVIKWYTGVDMVGNTPLANEDKQTQMVRETAYKLIDMQAMIFKAQVDVAIELWESAPAEQKDHIKNQILERIQEIKVPDMKDIIKRP